jgi:hypothetical protein
VDSLKLAILKKITAHLQGMDYYRGNVKVAMTENIYRGRIQFGDETPMPAINIIDAPKPDVAIVAAEEGIVMKEGWLLLVQGWEKSRSINFPADDAYQLMAYTTQWLSRIVASDREGNPAYPDVFMLGGSIEGMSLGPGVARPPQEGVSAESFFYLPVNVTLVTDVRNPFASVTQP